MIRMKDFTEDERETIGKCFLNYLDRPTEAGRLETINKILEIAERHYNYKKMWEKLKKVIESKRFSSATRWLYLIPFIEQKMQQIEKELEG